MKLCELVQHADVPRVRLKVVKDGLPRGEMYYMRENIPLMVDRYGGCDVQTFQADSIGIVATIKVG